MNTQYPILYSKEDQDYLRARHYKSREIPAGDEAGMPVHLRCIEWVRRHGYKHTVFAVLSVLLLLDFLLIAATAVFDYMGRGTHAVCEWLYKYHEKLE